MSGKDAFVASACGAGIFCTIFVCVLLKMHETSQNQQRQIDQLNALVLNLVAKQESTEDGDTMSTGRYYDFLFADFTKGIAVLWSYDPKEYPKKGNYFIAHGVPRETLKRWAESPRNVQ